MLEWVTVLDPAASRMAALLTGLSGSPFEAEDEELADDLEDPSEALDEEELVSFGLGSEDEEAALGDVGFAEEDVGFASAELEELAFAALAELDSSFPFPLSLSSLLPSGSVLPFCFSCSCFAFSFFIASNLAAFAFSSSLGLEDELELELASFPPLLVDTAADADGDAEVPDAGGSGCELSSCETSWMEKNRRRRKPKLLFTMMFS